MRVVVFVLLLATMRAGAQQPIPNGDFESWQLFPGSGSFNDYEEPTGGWASGNGVIHVAANADPVCEKSTDAHSGTYAAKLTTRTIFGQIASGSLYTGRFQLNLGNPRESARLGMAYTDKPMRFTGYYRYLPEGGDSAVIRATFRRWTGTERQVVSEALLKVYSRVESWTQFEILIPAFAADPDTVEVVFAASAGGEFFRGSPGSTLYIDDVAFDNASRVHAEQTDHTVPVAAWIADRATLWFADDHLGEPFTVFTYNGTILEHGTAAREVSMHHLSAGVYGVQCAGRTILFVR